MVLKLYSFPASTCSQRIGMVLNEKGVPFELHIIDMAKKEHKSAEFLKIQPFGQVPYIVRLLYAPSSPSTFVLTLEFSVG